MIFFDACRESEKNKYFKERGKKKNGEIGKNEGKKGETLRERHLSHRRLPVLVRFGKSLATFQLDVRGGHVQDPIGWVGLWGKLDPCE